MKGLYMIQKLHKLGQKCSKMLFAVSVSGACLSLIALLSQKLPDNSVKTGMITIYGLFSHTADCSLLYHILLLCLEKAILAGYACHYFEKENAEGTVFSVRCAKELLRFGVMFLIIPNVHSFLQILLSCFTKLQDMNIVNTGNWGEMTAGITALLMSLICYSAAECISEYKK